jgi:hypothetical protein
MPDNAERRARFVINPRLQRRLVLSATLPLLIVLGILLPAQLFRDMRLVSQLAERNLEVNEVVSRPISTLLFFVFAVGYVVLVSLRLSHRVAGASHRICETLKSFRAGGREARADLRQGDFLVELAESVNSFLDWTAGEESAPGGRPAEKHAPAEPRARARQDPAGSSLLPAADTLDPVPLRGSAED